MSYDYAKTSLHLLKKTSLSCIYLKRKRKEKKTRTSCMTLHRAKRLLNSRINRDHFYFSAFEIPRRKCGGNSMKTYGEKLACTNKRN